MPLPSTPSLLLLCLLPHALTAQTIRTPSSRIYSSQTGLRRIRSFFLPTSKISSSCVARPTSNGRIISDSARRRRPQRMRPVQAEKQQFESFEDMLKNFELPVLVDFYATWCGPCQIMEKELETVQTTLRNKIQVVKIDTDQHQSIATAQEVYGLPTMALFKEGKQIWRMEGAMPAAKLIQTLEKYLD